VASSRESRSKTYSYMIRSIKTSLLIEGEGGRPYDVQRKKASVVCLGLEPRKTQTAKSEGCQRFYSVTPDDHLFY
jgi:hypothetical protein